MKVQEKHDGFHRKHKDEKQMLYIVDTYGNMILALVERHLFTLPDQQESCVYSTLLEIWEHLLCFDSKQTTLKSWIGAVTRYQCLEYLKNYQQNRELAGVFKQEEPPADKEDKMLLWLIRQEIAEEEELMLSCLNEEDGKALLNGGPMIYHILNQVETDFYEYETKPNLTQELAMIKKNLRKKIRDQHSALDLRDGLFALFAMLGAKSAAHKMRTNP